MTLFAKNNLVFYCPLNGEIAPLSKTPSDAFSHDLLGTGIVIFPNENKVYAPTDAKINFIFPTKHAIGFETKSGYEYLIHVGIDTNQLKGNGFKLHVQSGDYVKQGQLLLDFDLDLIQSHGLSIATPVVFPNASQIDVLKYGQAKANDKLLIVKRK